MGATPQGIAAAVAAAREGLRVVLAEPDREVGGVLTRGWLATLDVARDDRGGLLQQGLFAELYRDLGHDPSFDVGQAATVMDEWATRPGITLQLERRLVRVLQRDGWIQAVVLDGPDGQQVLQAPLFIDASDTADLARAAGARFTVGREDTTLDRRQMAAGLVLRLRGVPWDVLCAQARETSRRAHDGSGCAGRSAWGWGRLAAGYRPGDPARFHLRGLNVARQDDGSLLVDALEIYGVDATSAASIDEAYRAAAIEAPRVVQYLREADPAVFAGAVLDGVAPRLYLRESRHLVGLYRLRADDVLYGRYFPDSVAVGGYPLDGQTYVPGEPPYLLGVPAPFGVPLRTLVPADLHNLLVVSQAASFDSTAAFSARVVPLQVALGEAAGVAAWVARTRREPLDELVLHPEDVTQVRQLLARRGARLAAEPQGPAGAVGARLQPAGGWRWVVPSQDEADPAYPEAIALLRMGLFAGSYVERGGLYLAQPATIGEFLDDLEHLLRSLDAFEAPRLEEAWRSFEPRRNQWLADADAVAILRLLGPAGDEAARHLERHNRGNPPFVRRGRVAEVVWQLTNSLRSGSVMLR
ncbi:MAG: FAD-dependent oxidoreductase [Limnochordaceae bacterium]|nr:FAD-dependent oxidoreductase [Limnochordaceae bacterium]